MTAHLAVPAIEPEEIPATISQKVLTGLLREELGFKGIIVTDAMDMQGLTKQFGPGEASVRALEAGVDMLLMPTDPEQAINAVMAAIREGRLTRARIDQSVVKILAAKIRVGLGRQRLVETENISDTIDNPDADERAQGVANHAVTLLRNEGEQVPLKDPDHSCVIVLTENRYTQQGRQFVLEMRQRSPQALQVRVLDPTTPQAELLDTIAMAGQCKVVVIAAFVTVNAYRGNVALPGDFPNMVQTILNSRVPVTLIAFGNPYLLRSFPNVGAYMATFSTTTTSEIAAAKTLLGEIAIQGRMPVEHSRICGGGRRYSKGGPTSMIEITWLGHGTVQLRLESGEVYLLDPWTEGNPAYPKSHKFDRIDCMVISHGHFDHIHDAVPLAKKFEPRR